MTVKKRRDWVLPFFVFWAFAAVEGAFHLNIAIHWDALNWRDFDVLNNRPAFAVSLLAGLAFCYLEFQDWATRFTLWIPVAATLMFVAIPSEMLWLIAVPSAYPDRVTYALGQWGYTSALFFPIATLVDKLSSMEIE